MDTITIIQESQPTKKVDISLRQLIDIDETGGIRAEVDKTEGKITNNQILTAYAEKIDPDGTLGKVKTFRFKNLASIITGGTGVTVTTDKDGITTISNSGVRKIIAGTNVTISPVSGLGDVTINAAGGGGGGGYVPYVGATANVDLGEYELKAGQLSLDISPTGTAAVGTTRWNNTIGSSETTLKGGSVILKNGVDLVARIVNKVTPNTTLTKAAYQAVRVSGAAGQRLAVEFAQANNDANSADTIGLVTETIATNQEGFIMTVGNLEEINTTGSLQGETWVDGDILYLSPTIAGQLTNIKPVAPDHLVVVGYVEYAHAVHGKIYVKCDNGYEIDELHNVYINAPTTWQVLRYDATAGYWTNSSLSASILPSGIDAAKIGAGTVDNTEFGYLDGVTSSIQTQLNDKVPTTRSLTINGTAYDLSADRSWSVGTFNLPALTNGSVLFSNGTTIAQDNANLFWDDAQNRLGIRTNTPQSAFHIIDESTDDPLLFYKYNNNGALAGGFFASKARGTSSSPKAVLNGDRILTILGRPYRTVGGNSFNPYSTGIIFSASQDITAAANGSQMSFETTLNGTVSRTSKMVLFGTGNLLLQNGGTFTDAGFRLDVQGTSRFTGAATFNNNMAIGGTLAVGTFSAAVASAQLEVVSTTKGFLPPRMTTAQKNAIASPAAGLVVYDTTLGKLCVRTASAWETITSV